MEQRLLISDAAKRVQVENHVLRYWEEELKLPIKRNEAGHRYYTEDDIARFTQIKTMKERGLQLKAIKMILKDGRLDVLSENDEVLKNGVVSENGVVPENNEAPKNNESREAVYKEAEESESVGGMAIQIVQKEELQTVREESKEEKAQRLQWLLKQLFKETLMENNQEMCNEIRDSVIKELDYQFRCQEERENEREKIREQRSEEYYQKMDELLRKKSSRIKPEKKVRTEKKKRHLSS